MARTQGSHSDITGPKVREAALRLFARYGYAAVSMRKIAAEVGVQAGALYNYTPDKQSLLFDLLRSHMDALLAARATQPADNGPLGALEQFTRFHIRFHSERPDAVFVSYMELRNLNPENFCIIEGLRREYEAQLEEIMQRGMAEGLFEIPEPRIATMAVIGMLTGIITWYSAAGRLSLDEIEALYWEMVRKLVSAT